MVETKKKKWPGRRKKKKPRSHLIGDSYQADPTDLKRLRQIRDKTGIAKSELVRLGVKLLIWDYDTQGAWRKK